MERLYQPFVLRYKNVSFSLSLLLMTDRKTPPRLSSSSSNFAVDKKKIPRVVWRVSELLHPAVIRTYSCSLAWPLSPLAPYGAINQAQRTKTRVKSSSNDENSPQWRKSKHYNAWFFSPLIFHSLFSTQSEGEQFYRLRINITPIHLYFFSLRTLSLAGNRWTSSNSGKSLHCVRICKYVSLRDYDPMHFVRVWKIDWSRLLLFGCGFYFLRGWRGNCGNWQRQSALFWH